MTLPESVTLRILDEHYRYLADTVRVSAYTRALQAVIQPTDRVLDLGCGSGILGILACQAGATSVVAIDRTDMIELARRIAREAGYSDRITYEHAESQRVSLADKATVLVCDQLGPLGFEAGLIAAAADAAARLLTPEARFIPHEFSTWLAPVESPQCHARIDRWQRPSAGITLHSVLPIARAMIQPAFPDSVTALGEFAPAFTVGVGRHSAATLRAHVRWRIARAGRMHGIAGGFIATLAPGITISNLPNRADGIHRSLAVLPVWPEIEVDVADEVQVDLLVRPDAVVAWHLTVTRDSQTLAHQSRSTLESRLWPSGPIAPARR